MQGAPSGTVTFLFTDIEGSTAHWERHGDLMRSAVELHDRLSREAFERHGGFVFATGGDGFGVAFHRAGDALEAAIRLDRDLREATWPIGELLRVRFGCHTGEADERGGDYFGTAVNRAARIADAGHGGQLLCSATTAALASMPTRSRGKHRLRGFVDPEEIHEIVVDDGEAREFGNLRTSGVARSTLPTPATSLVGRHAEVEALCEVVRRERMATLTGAGGSGKTRLAIETGHAMLAEFPDGVFFVDLAPVNNEADVAGAFATGIGVASDGASDRIGEVGAALGAGMCLVVVDNCEHVLDETADIVEFLIAACPSLHVLTTSRESLGLDGEHTTRVPGLSELEAVELFCVRSGLDPTDDERAAVIEIARRLDRLPLAIELAAARTAMLSPAEIRDRLDDRFSVLTGGRRRTRGRQATLRAAIDWSFDLLAIEERSALLSLSVFPGSFDLDVAGAVMDVPPARAFEIVDSLIAQSLLVTTTNLVGATAYRLLETIRVYAYEKLLDAGTADDAHSRHAAHVAERGRKAMAPYLPGLMALGDDVTASYEWARARDDALVPELTMLYIGVLSRSRHDDRAIALAEDLSLDALVTHTSALNVALSYLRKGNGGRMLELFDRAIEVAEDPRLTVYPRFWRMAVRVLEDPAGFERDLAVIREVGTEAAPDDRVFGAQWMRHQLCFLEGFRAAAHGDQATAIERYTAGVSSLDPNWVDTEWAGIIVWNTVGAFLASALSPEPVRPNDVFAALPTTISSPVVAASEDFLMMAAGLPLAGAVAYAAVGDEKQCRHRLEAFLDWAATRVNHTADVQLTIAVALAMILEFRGETELRNRLLPFFAGGDLAWVPPTVAFILGIDGIDLETNRGLLARATSGGGIGAVPPELTEAVKSGFAALDLSWL